MVTSDMSKQHCKQFYFYVGTHTYLLSCAHANYKAMYIIMLICTFSETTDNSRQFGIINKLSHQVTECVHLLLAIGDEDNVVKDRSIASLRC